jgi:hypothetical protein
VELAASCDSLKSCLKGSASPLAHHPAALAAWLRSCDARLILCHKQDKRLGPGYRLPRPGLALTAQQILRLDPARVPQLPMFSSRCKPPIDTRCKPGEFAPKVSQSLVNNSPTARLSPISSSGGRDPAGQRGNLHLSKLAPTGLAL